MIRYIIPALTILLSLIFSQSSFANPAPSELTKEQAINIISTLEELHPRHYHIIHMMEGTREEKDGFRHKLAMRVRFFGPKDNRDTRRVLRCYTMLHSAEYGWFLQRIGDDARGYYMEISSQTRGRIFIR
jgi:hypothetical protein